MLVLLLNGVTSTGPGPAVQYVKNPTLQANYTGSVSGQYPQVLIEASLDGVNYSAVGTINISSSPQSGLLTLTGEWAYLRGNVTQFGTGGGSFTLYALD